MSESKSGHLPHWRRSLTWRVILNSGWATAATPVTVLLGTVQIGMLARMIGPEGIGIVALFQAICAFIASTLKFTSTDVAMVYTTKALQQGDREQAVHFIRYCYMLDFVTSFLAFGAVPISAVLFPRLLDLPLEHRWLLLPFGLTIVLQSTHWVSHSVLRLANRFAWTFYQASAHSIIKTLFIGLIFVRGGDLKAVVFVFVGMALLDGVSLFIMADLALRHEGLRIFGRIGRWWRVPGELWRFQILGKGRSITKVLYAHLDTLMIGYLSDPLSVGLFRSAKQLTSLLSMPTQALISSLSPEYSRLWFNGDIRRLRELVLRFSLIMLAMFLILASCLVLFADLAIRIVLGDAFLSAKEPILILVLAALLAIFMAPLNSVQVATGRAGPSMLAGVATIISQALLMIILVPNLGISGAAWAKVGGLLASLAIMIPTGIMRLQGSACSQRALASSETDEDTFEILA